MYGTVVAFAVLSMNVRSRLPESIKVPRVGQPEAGKGCVVGAYDRVSRPTALKTSSYLVAGKLLMLTINKDNTGEPSEKSKSL